jgi:hypothetical protein
MGIKMGIKRSSFLRVTERVVLETCPDTGNRAIP